MINELNILKALLTTLLNPNKLLDAWKFSKSVERNLFFIAERIHRDLRLPFPEIKFGFKEKLRTIAYYMLNRGSSWYTYLLERFIVEQFLRQVGDLLIDKNTFLIFIIFLYRDDLGVKYRDSIIDIDIDIVMEKLYHLKSDESKWKLLVSLVYLARHRARIEFKLLLEKAKELQPSKAVINETLSHIEQVIRHKYATTSFILKTFHDVADREKILKTLNIIEEKIRSVVSRSIDIERLLLVIETVRRHFEAPYKGRYLLMLFIREAGYNILYTYPELFIEKLPDKRSKKVKFLPLRELSKEEFYSLESTLFGLTLDAHLLDDIKGVVRPIAYLTHVPRTIQIGKSKHLVKGRIGILYLIETREKVKPEVLWDSFKKLVLSDKALELPLAYIIVEIGETHTYSTQSLDSPLKARKFYHVSGYKKKVNDKRIKRFIKLIEVERVSVEEAIIAKRGLIYNLLEEKAMERIVIPEKELLTYGKLLRELLRLSDLITEFQVSEEVKKKLDSMENEIINNIKKYFPGLDIERPLDLWFLYKDENMREKAVHVLSNSLDKLFPSIATLVAKDILYTAYIASILGPYIQHSLLQKVSEGTKD